MLQARLVKEKEFILEEVDIPTIESNDILIEVKVSGICGSDLHVYNGLHPFVKPPVVLGHELSGIIVGRGSNVLEQQFPIGQKVTIEPSITCGECFNCKNGRYNICQDLNVIGFEITGGFSHYIKVPVNKVIPLPRELKFTDGAMIEPVSAAIHAAKIGKVKPKDHVLIIGAGTIGILLSQVLKGMGATVCVADILDSRLQIASKTGTDFCINTKKVDIDKQLSTLFPHDGIDVIFECAGVAETLKKSIEIARKGSRIVMVGLQDNEINIPVQYIQDGELEIIGTQMYTRTDFEDAIKLVTNNKVKLDYLKTKSFNLEEINQAFKYITSSPSETLKVFLKNNL